jgi:hypothetical protein
MKEIKNPLIANIDRSSGNIEISIAKKYKKEEEGMYKSFMSVCSMEDKELVDTSEMDNDQTIKACGMQYDKMRAMINEEGKGGLTEKQKKLPPALQKVILQKMKKEGKLSEEAEAAYSKLLSKDDQKKKEVSPEEEIKVVKKKDA